MSNVLKRKIPVENLRLSTRIKPETINEEQRTVEVVFSSGARGRRDSWFGPYYEELEISEQAIKLDRLNSGAPVLKDHASMTIDNQIGVVERAWVDGTVAKAILRFAKDDASELVWQKVRDGILKNISVGYEPSYEDVSTESDEIPILRATSWEPFEISIVTIPFDAHAQIRNEADKFKTVNILTHRELNTMGKKRDDDDKKKLEEQIKALREEKEELEEQLREKEDDEEKSREKEDDEERDDENEDKKEAKKREDKKDEDEERSMSRKNRTLQDAVRAEQARCLEIRKLVKTSGMNEDLAEVYIERNASVEDVKTNIELFSKYQKENDSTNVQGTSVEVTETNEAQRRDGIVEAILHQSDSKNFQATDRSKRFIGSSLLRMLEQHVGRNSFESDTQFVKRVMSSSDLPYILANVAEKTALKRYQLAPKTFEAWTTKGTLKDFKESLQVRGGDVGVLEEIKEGGEYKEDTIGEEAEFARLRKYGKMHQFTDIMIINDDLDMILAIAQEAGVAQARLDNKLAYDVLKSNPLMNDGKNLFSADHRNVGTPRAIGEDSVSEARKAMRTQKSVDQRDVLNVAPKFLIVGPELETTAQKFLELINPTKTQDVNIFSRSLDLVVDAEIEDSQYYFVADPVLVPGVKINRLSGQENIRVESRVKWSTDSIQLKLRYAATANPVDYRSLYRNEGAGEE